MIYTQDEKEVFVLIEKGEFYAVFDSLTSAQNVFQESAEFRFRVLTPLKWEIPEMSEGLWYLAKEHGLGEVKIIQCPIHKVLNG